MLGRILVALVLVAAGSGVSSGPDVVVGAALTTGPAFLNGTPITASTVVTNGDRLETGARGTATVNLSSRDRLQLSEASAITFHTRNGGVWAEVEQGSVLVSAAHDRLREVRLAAEAVSIRPEPGPARRYQVARLKDRAYVLANSGNITIVDEGYGKTVEVPEGMAGLIRGEAELPEPPQQPARRAAPASGSHAGQITAIIPVGYVVRGADRTPGNKGDTILWNDKVETEKQGRARVVLDDGSILSVGSESSLTVTQHNAANQQSDLFLAYGRVRAEVRKLTAPNAKFEVRTRTAVCGVLGTDFALVVENDKTILTVFKGRVSFRPVAAGVVAAATAGVTVVAGQTSTAVAGSVAAPVSSGTTAASAAAATTVGTQAGTTAASTVAVTTISAATAGATAGISAGTNPSDTGRPPIAVVSPARP